MLIIVNADDLGTSEYINDSIFALMEAGLVTSATLIGNAPAFEHAVRQVSRFPKCSFGVHLNLTVFAPLSSPKSLDPILDEQRHLSQKLLYTKVPSSLREACQEELMRQVGRVIEAGVPVSHFDSHQHIHTIPALFPVLKAVQRKFNISRVRSTINLLPYGTKMHPVRAIKKGVFNIALRHYRRTRCPEGLGDFRDFHAALSAGSLRRFRALELMVHPGADSGHYTVETDLLRSNWQSLLPSYAALASYHSI